MELRRYLLLIWKWLWLAVVAGGLAGGTSYLYTRQSAKFYQASIQVLVGQSIQTPNANAGDIYTSQQLAQTYVLLAKTDTVMRGVIDTLGLPMSPDQLRSMVSATIVQGTQIIEFRVSDTDPQRAQAIANEYAHQMTLQGPTMKDDKETARRDFIQRQVDDTQKKIEDAQKKVEELQKSMNVVGLGARDLADKQQQINSLLGQMNQWQSTYAALLSSLGQRSPNYLSIIEPARLPTTPIGPNTSTDIFLAVAIGVALAAGVAFLIEYIDDTVKTPDDVAQSLNLPSLGVVADIWGETPSEKLIALKHPRASHSEAYRTLRTNIQVADLDKPLKTLLVTSSNPGEGKSVTSANLSVVMAQTGQHVILVDADMRRPAINRVFRLTNDYGLTTALLQPEVALETFLQATEIENLRVMTTGPLPPNPAELLGSKRMHALIERLKDVSDIVIFDTPPILPRTDAAVLARQLDGILLVVDAGSTRRDSALRSKQILEHAGGHILGVMLNRVVPQSDSYYYYYYYSDDGNKKRPVSLFARIFRQLSHRVELVKWFTK